MTKRILSAALALLVALTLLPAQCLAAGGYTIGVQAGSSVNNGSSITVTLDLSKSQAGTYNAFDVSLSYDPAKLEYQACSLPDTQVQHTRGSIRLVGYGEEKARSTPLAVLTFQAKAAGASTVQISSAKIDNSSNAIDFDAPQAACDPKAVTINIKQAYTVTLADGLTADSMEAIRGQTYTFKAADYDNYIYVITAKVNGQKVTVTDHKNGTYTIPGALVTGDITVEIEEKTAKSYDVTFTGQDVSGEKKATYNTPYVFKLNRKTVYDYTVAVTIGGKEYKKYTVENDAYTIPGPDITGKIIVKVTKVRKNSTTGSTGSGGTSGSGNRNLLQVSINGSGEGDVTGQATVKKGSSYSFKIKRAQGYRYEVSVQIDGKNVEYTYDQETDSYTIPASVMTGNVTIVVTKIVEPLVTEYLTLERESIYLVLVAGTVDDGQIPKFDGRSLYRSPIYPGYTWLISSSESGDSVRMLAEENITITDGKTEATVDYSGNVDLRGGIDINDAQLVYDMYNAKYRLEELSMTEFLGADVNGDQYVNTLDVVWLLNSIRIREQGGVV